MKVSQVATLINSVTSEIIGDSAVINEDLSNVVDIGKAIFDNTSYDNFVRTLVDHIGRVIFVDRVYTGNTLAVKRESWEYGAALEGNHICSWRCEKSWKKCHYGKNHS